MSLKAMLQSQVLPQMRSPFSLLLVKCVGPNNFCLRQLKIVGVGATIGPSVGAIFGPFVGPTFLGSQNCQSYFRPFCWAKIVGGNNGPFVGRTFGPSVGSAFYGQEPISVGPTQGPKVTPTFLGAPNCWSYK